MTDYERARYEDAKLAHKALMKYYPLGIEDLDGEEWRDVEGYEGHYQISNYGNHIDGCKMNNFVENLEWATQEKILFAPFAPD